MNDKKGDKKADSKQTSKYPVNLLDTPGHEDFSEDTYRTLTAVDSALMVIDCAKGVEQRTIKLMEVCRLRDTPIMTFINKLDRDGRQPIEVALGRDDDAAGAAHGLNHHRGDGVAPVHGDNPVEVIRELGAILRLADAEGVAG